MASFGSVREAKEYLVGRIVAEARRDRVPLSEVETKMLYFSETGWTLPDMMKVNEEFDRDYDQDEYEEKIGGLVGNWLKWAEKANQSELDSWYTAVQVLSDEDHYLLVLIRPPSGRPAGGSKRPPGDLLKLWLTALACVFGGLFLIALFNGAFGPK